MHISRSFKCVIASFDATYGNRDALAKVPAAAEADRGMGRFAPYELI